MSIMLGLSRGQEKSFFFLMCFQSALLFTAVYCWPIILIMILFVDLAGDRCLISITLSLQPCVRLSPLSPSSYLFIIIYYYERR